MARADIGTENHALAASPLPVMSLERYGATVALWGEHAIVTDRNAQHLDASPSGAAFAFERNGGVFQLQQMLAPVSADEHPNSVVAIHGNTAMVRRWASAIFPYVAVYQHDGTAWLPAQTLPSPSLGGGFGHAIDIQGDVAVIGRPGSFMDARAVVYRRVGGTWLLQQQLDSSPQLNGSFGRAVALDGDTLAVGAPSSVVNGVINAGSVYVFVRNPATDTWSVQQRLTSSDVFDGAFFGGHIDLAGDRLLVSRLTGGIAPEAVYLFERSGGVWAQMDTWPSPVSSGPHFGEVVQLAEHTAVVTAPSLKIDGTPSAGGAFVYVRLASGDWVEQRMLQRALPQTLDHLGEAASMYGTELLLGGSGYNTPNNHGVALLFELPAPNGSPCGVVDHCMSGLCVDGVCCDSPCGGGALDCQACSVAAGAAEDGSCGPLNSIMLECRAAASDCDMPESCDASSTECPPDAFALDGSACNDGDDCTTQDQCVTGVCEGLYICNETGTGGAAGATASSGGHSTVGGGGAGSGDIIVTSSCGCTLVGTRARASRRWSLTAMMLAWLVCFGGRRRRRIQ